MFCLVAVKAIVRLKPSMGRKKEFEHMTASGQFGNIAIAIDL